MKKFITVLSILVLAMTACTNQKYAAAVQDAGGELDVMTAVVGNMENSTDKIMSLDDSMQMRYLHRCDEIEQEMQTICDNILNSKNPSLEALDICGDAVDVIGKCGTLKSSIINIASKNVISDYLVTHPATAMSVYLLMNY